tara:strand:- start:361 stop:687 length:327 start_codon:yes stop_codon:yes gene_type:complete
MGIERGNMPFQKGQKKTGGKKKGYTSKATENAREAIANLVEKNTPQMIKWLEQIAEESPKEAFDCMTKVMEYHLPKLARTESTVESDNVHKHVFVSAIKSAPNEANEH